MTAEEYAKQHRREARLYGVLPLTDVRLRQFHAEGRSVAFAYSVACDINSGFAASESIAAAIRAGV